MKKAMALFFTGSNYNKQEIKCNEMGQSHMNLTHLGIFRSTFTEDSHAYSYAADFCPITLGSEELEQRVALYGANGWSQISKNKIGWQMYRTATSSPTPTLPIARSQNFSKNVNTLYALSSTLALVLLGGLSLMVATIIGDFITYWVGLGYGAMVLLLLFKFQAVQNRLRVFDPPKPKS